MSENRSYRNEMPENGDIQEIQYHMELYLQQARNNTINLYEKYKDDPKMLVAISNGEGNIAMLEDIFFISKKLDIHYLSADKWNWLHKCNLSFAAPLSVMEFYIKHGVEINAQDMYGMTPLHYAMREKNIEGAIALLNAGADPNIPDRDNAIALAYINGMPEEIELLKLMWEKGGDVHFNNGQHEILEGIKKYSSEDPKFKPVIELMEKYA